MTAVPSLKESSSLPRRIGMDLGTLKSAIIGIDLRACHFAWNAIEAEPILSEKGISVELINIHTIKPLDIEAIPQRNC